jgi:hypothetical protein
MCRVGALRPLLTPKGLNVRTANKLVLVSVTCAHTIFRFLKLFVKMYLTVSFVEKKMDL